MTDAKPKIRTYAQGYAAGQRRVVREGARENMAAQREQFRRDVFLAILPELVRSPWRTGEKTWATMEQFIDGAWNFADLAGKNTFFTPGEGS